MDHKTILELYKAAIVSRNDAARLFLYDQAEWAGIDERTLEHASECAQDEIEAMQEVAYESSEY